MIWCFVSFFCTQTFNKSGPRFFSVPTRQRDHLQVPALMKRMSMCQYLKPNTLPRAKILTRAKFFKKIRKKTLSENSSNSCVQTAATKPPGPKATSAATNTRPLICANQMALNSHLLLNWAPVHTTLRYSTATAFPNKLLATQQKKKNRRGVTEVQRGRDVQCN